MSFKVFLLSLLFAAISVSVCLTAVFASTKSGTFSKKQTELFSAASDFSTSFSAYATNPQTPGFSFSETKKRFIVTDSNLVVVYDSSEIENLTSKTLFLPSTLTALQGEKFFENTILTNSVESVLAIPFKINNSDGTLLILESDSSLAEFLHYIFISCIFSLIVTALLFVLLFGAFAHLLKRRISNLMTSIKQSRDEFGTEKIAVLRHDEIAPVIEEFNNIYEQLNYVQQMRQAFVSDASHELRTPLAAIRLLCESITGTENVDLETAKEFLEDIVLEVDRMSHTAEKLLVLSRLDNTSSAMLSPVPISDLVRNSITALTPFADDKEIKIQSFIEDDCTILGEMEGTNQIIGNIIDNAIKYNNPGGLIKVFLFSKNGNCHFIADDTGIGISPEFREQVFERFYRVDKSRKHDGRGGSGLGLAIVKRNIEAFGGSITISDSPCGGTRFTVIFPGITTEEAYF